MPVADGAGLPSAAFLRSATIPGLPVLSRQRRILQRRVRSPAVPPSPVYGRTSRAPSVPLRHDHRNLQQLSQHLTAFDQSIQRCKYPVFVPVRENRHPDHTVTGIFMARPAIEQMRQHTRQSPGKFLPVPVSFRNWFPAAVLPVSDPGGGQSRRHPANAGRGCTAGRFPADTPLIQNRGRQQFPERTKAQGGSDIPAFRWINLSRQCAEKGRPHSVDITGWTDGAPPWRHPRPAQFRRCKAGRTGKPFRIRLPRGPPAANCQYQTTHRIPQIFGTANGVLSFYQQDIVGLDIQ